MDPRKMQMLFAVILLPATMLGCVYYPWSALHSIRWLQILVLINPMVYMSEGLRAVLTPVLGHMPLWAVLVALIGGTVVFGYLGTRTFTKRVLNAQVQAADRRTYWGSFGQRPTGTGIYRRVPGTIGRGNTTQRHLAVSLRC
jgi:hypothetical protein